MRDEIMETKMLLGEYVFDELPTNHKLALMIFPQIYSKFRNEEDIELLNNLEEFIGVIDEDHLSSSSNFPLPYEALETLETLEMDEKEKI